MPFNLGPGELFLLAIAALLIFGPKKLPELGRSIGETLGSLRKAYNSALNDTPAQTAQPIQASAAQAEHKAEPETDAQNPDHTTEKA